MTCSSWLTHHTALIVLIIRMVEGWSPEPLSSKALQWPGAKASLAVKVERNLRHLDIRTLAGELEGFRAVQTMNLNHEAMADLHLK